MAYRIAQDAFPSHSFYTSVIEILDWLGTEVGIDRAGGRPIHHEWELLINHFGSEENALEQMALEATQLRSISNRIK